MSERICYMILRINVKMYLSANIYLKYLNKLEIFFSNKAKN